MKISLLGSTGSIGVQTLEVCKKHNIAVKSLSAKSNVALLAMQAKAFSVNTVCIFDEDKAEELALLLKGTDIKIITGMAGLCEIASDNSVDLFVNAVVGMVGLLPTLKAIEAKNNIALANKETLVAGGELVMKSAAKNGVSIYPIDSEHSAIFQCLQGNKLSEVNKIFLTASGGAFFGKTKSELEKITLEQALCHPNWEMGKKITIDSSTLMNKGLEFIEAKHLFNLSPEQIEIVVNRESVLHSAVEFSDNSVIAQMGVPDMKIPIQYALLYPKRAECDVKPLSFTDYGTLHFYKPDYETFDCLSACIKAIKLGGNYPCIVNSVNEEAVDMFLNRKISFLQIGEIVMSSLEHFSYKEINSYEDIVDTDKAARKFAREFAQNIGGNSLV